ncbi:MAG: hypothetical protein WC855_01615 [Thermodesulfovibrionales bacterium]
MDVNFFLNLRTTFIRQFYENASISFFERQRKIEAGEYPFIPPYSEDGEPPFLEEWTEADEALQLLGYSCISMLASALHLYLKTLETEFEVPVAASLKSEFKKNGWFNGYKAYFLTNFGIRFESGPFNISTLEEIVCARNRAQHPKNITTQRVSYSSKDIKKFPQVFFVDDREKMLFAAIEVSESSWLYRPTIHITKEKLFAAIAEVEKFNGWLEEQIDAHM